MISFYDLYQRCLTVTKDSSTANTTLMKALVNEHHMQVCGIRDWAFLEKERTGASVASQQKYRLPVDYGRLLSFWTVVGGVVYHPDEVLTKEKWDALNATSVSSDITTDFIILEDYIHLWPIPSSTSVTLHLLYRRNPVEMSQDDYTTGTVTNTAGSRTVTGTGTTFTEAMEGRFIRIAGTWYEIEDFTSATSITLTEYTIKGCSGEATKIGEVPIIPEDFQDLLWKGPVADYYDFKGNVGVENPWRKEYEKRLAQLISRYGGGQKTASQVITKGGEVLNPQDYPTGLHE